GIHTRINAAQAPAIAASDPRVVYAPTNGNDAQGNWQAGLLRTDDGGRTWHDLALPVPGKDVNFITTFISPLDPRHVYLLLSDQTRGADCPSGQGGNARIGGNVLASGSGFCALEYSSADAGAHWTPVRLPVPGVLTATDIKLPTLPAQGGRLYATTTCYD